MQPVGGRANQRDNNEDTPQSVHDTGNGCKKLDDHLQQVLNADRHRSPEVVVRQSKYRYQRVQPEREKALTQENRDREPEYGADDEPENRAVERAPDGGQDSELRAVRVPGGAGQR